MTHFWVSRITAFENVYIFLFIAISGLIVDCSLIPKNVMKKYNYSVLLFEEIWKANKVPIFTFGHHPIPSKSPMNLKKFPRTDKVKALYKIGTNL